MAHAQGPSEAAVKAAFLAKFGAYVTWPTAEGPITLCLVGREVFGDALEQVVSGHEINGRAIALRKLDTIAADSGCDIAYIAGSRDQPIPAALASLRSAPVLTVTDGRWSSARGMVHFQVSANRVRFHIDDRAAAQSRLGISSNLLKIALSVRPRSAAR